MTAKLFFNIKNKSNHVIDFLKLKDIINYVIAKENYLQIWYLLK